MSSGAKANSGSVDSSFDTLLSQHFAAIDEKLGVVLDLDSMMGQSFHYALYFWALRVIAPRLSPAFREVNPACKLRLTRVRG